MAAKPYGGGQPLKADAKTIKRLETLVAKHNDLTYDEYQRTGFRRRLLSERVDESGVSSNDGAAGRGGAGTRRGVPAGSSAARSGWVGNFGGVRRSATALIIAGLGVLAGTASAQMFDFQNIQNWTGTGSNEAAMVVDWHDDKTPESLVWGYRFNGPATGLDMIQAIDAADPRLEFFFQYGGGYIYGIGYDLDNNGGTFTPGTPGYDSDGNSTETGSASDPDNHYAEGVFSKFWGYDTAEASPYGGGGTWTESPVGAGDRTLANGSWDGWSLSYDEQNFSIPDPRFPVAAAANAPEPSTLATAFSALGMLGLAIGARRFLPGSVRG